MKDDIENHYLNGKIRKVNIGFVVFPLWENLITSMFQIPSSQAIVTRRMTLEHDILILPWNISQHSVIHDDWGYWNLERITNNRSSVQYGTKIMYYVNIIWNYSLIYKTIIYFQFRITIKKKNLGLEYCKVPVLLVVRYSVGILSTY